MISVLVADDHGVLRAGVRSVLDAEGDIEVCAEAGDGVEALKAIAARPPDVAILDISMPNLDGLETLDTIRKLYPGVKTILFSIHQESAVIRDAVARGADGYLLKSAATREIVDAIRAVAAGDNYFSPPITRELITVLRDGGDGSLDPYGQLSRREREVLHLIAEGLTAREVGDRLGISGKTVEAHRTSLMRKLGMKKATELVRYAVRQGLIEA
jgi:DNA-binding NarL/FixJ family response regulator